MSTAALNAWKADLGELLQGVLGKEAYVWARTRRAFLQGHHPSATETAGTSYSKHTWQLREANAASCSARAGRCHGVTTRLRRCPGHSSQARPMRQDKVSLPQERPWLLMVVGLHGDQQSDVVENQVLAAVEVRACGGGREGPFGARGAVPQSTARGGASSRDPAVWLGSPASRESCFLEHLPDQHRAHVTQPCRPYPWIFCGTAAA